MEESLGRVLKQVWPAFDPNGMANKKKAFDPSHSGTLTNIQQTVKEIGEQLRGIEEDMGKEAKNTGM